ncbi:MAG: MTAP family purine nucleoside phosphorylase [Bacteriovoracia bacterium]
MLAIIGGTGLYNLPNVKIVSEEIVETPFGTPSGPIIRARLDDKELLFLARHGVGHKFLPGEVNYRANIFALKKAGTKTVLSVSAVGSLRENLHPGDLVAIDQYLDFTKGKRISTFFGEGIAGHITGAYPVSKLLQQLILEVGNSLMFQKRKIHTSGTYVCVEGPRLGTRAESLMFRTLGADIVGMTNVPECFLAREAQIAYASVGVVTDYDSWQDDPSQHVDVSKIFALYSEALSDVVRLIESLIVRYSSSAIEECPSRTALKHSILTDENRLTHDSKELLKVLRL